jgi:hypothetical protein
MARYRALAGLAAAAMLAACATATPYQPAAPGVRAAQGFSEQRLEADRFRVSVQGNSITDRETVENQLLFRAAELTLQNGFDHFVVVSRTSDDDRKLVPIGGTPFRSSLLFWDYWRPGVGWTTIGWRGYDPFFDDPTYVERTRYRVSAEIVLRRGPKPEEDPAAFSAREVQDNLRARIVRPEAG